MGFFMSCGQNPTTSFPTSTVQNSNTNGASTSRRRSSSSSSRGRSGGGSSSNSPGGNSTSAGPGDPPVSCGDTACTEIDDPEEESCPSLTTLTFSKQTGFDESYQYGRYYHPDYRPIEDGDGCACFGVRQHYNLPSNQQSSSSPNQNIILAYFEVDGDGSMYLNADLVNWDNDNDKDYFFYHKVDDQTVQRAELTLRGSNPEGYSVCECPGLPDRNHKQIFVDMERDGGFSSDYGLRVKVWLAKEESDRCYFYRP